MTFYQKDTFLRTLQCIFVFKFVNLYKILLIMSDKKVIIDAPIQLTDGAVQQLQQLIVEKKVPDGHSLRVGVKGGGCAGFSYILGFDLPKDDDQQFEVKGIPVVMNKAHGIYLIGIEIDFVQGLNNRGFTFNNPNAKESCGCGESFSA